MVNVQMFYAKNATILIDAAGTWSTVAANVVLDTAASAGRTVTTQFKDVTITAPVADVTKVDLIGTTSSFQNAEKDEGTAPFGEISGTLVLGGDELTEAEIFGSGTSAPGSPTHTTYQPGLAARTEVEVLVSWDNGSEEINFVITNANITQWNLTQTADGHAAVALTFKCLPRDFYGPQFKN